MKYTLVALCLSSTLFTVQANERPDHYQAKASDTLAQAVANFSSSNQKLQRLLDSELTPERMVEIHEITYTLEVALEKIHTEAGILKDTLEEVHIASERMDTTTVKARGEAYLTSATTLVK